MITYFIKRGNFVKIGVTEDLSSRLASMVHASPEPIKILKITAIEERDAHKAAECLTERVSGEWFKINDDLMNWISSLNECLEGYTPEKRPAGRPANGKKSVKPNITLKKTVIEMAKNDAANRGIGLSQYVEAAILEFIKNREGVTQ